MGFVLRVRKMLMVLLVPGICLGQIRWTGAGGSQEWDNPDNWKEGRLPGAGDTVILDNVYLDEDYTVKLPGGNNPVALGRLVVHPGPGKNIKVIIGTDNVASPALSCTAHGGIIIKNGGILENASGASSGETILVPGGWRIETGGRYIHKTRRAHAALVSALIHDSLTLKGEFEFAIPFASNTISLSGRTYGTLRLMLADALDTVIYTAAGTAGLNILGDLVLGEGVNLKMNLGGTLTVSGDLVQYGGSFDLSTTARMLQVDIKGGLLQAGGEITTSGEVHSDMIFSGREEQVIVAKGKISNKVNLVINSDGVVNNLAPLYLPDALVMLQGILNTTKEFPLILSSNSRVIFNDDNVHSFIQGTVIKEGLNPEEKMVFPLGDRKRLGKIAVEGISGNLALSYKVANPLIYSKVYEEGIRRISSLEYWELKSEHETEGKITLYFPDGNSSGVTEMESLIIAYLKDSIWISGGRSSYEGSPGGKGSVTSETVLLEPQKNYRFSFASTQDFQNPLPVTIRNFQAFVQHQKLHASWQTGLETTEGRFRLEIFDHNRKKVREYEIPGASGKHAYSFEGDIRGLSGMFLLRLTFLRGNTQKLLAERAFRAGVGENIKILSVRHQPGKIMVEVEVAERENGRIVLMDQNGRRIKVTEVDFLQGKNLIPIENIYKRFALVYVFAVTSTSRSNLFYTWFP